MKLYEIKGALCSALDRMEVDEETGEIVEDVPPVPEE